MAKPFSLLIKPASADCNLRCSYCFYLEKGMLYPDTKRHRMSDDVLEHLISSYMATNQPVYAFGWQGGEPTVMGVDFFRKVTDLQKKFGRFGATVSNAIQTNATLIDDTFAAHLSEYKFLAGVSLDGPAEIHDFYRKNINGKGTHAEVLKGIDCLRRNNIEFNALTLVSSANVTRSREVYQYLREIGILYHQYIPCVEFDNYGQPLPWSITGEEWGEFLCELFDIWYASDTHRVSVRLFDSILACMVDSVRNICHIGDNCCQYFLVEHNGDVYPCDFFVDHELKLGNLLVDSWSDMQESEMYLSFGKRKTAWNERCDRCECRGYCMGDCIKHRMPNSSDASHLCAGWKMFFEHSITRFEKLVKEIRMARWQTGLSTRGVARVPAPEHTKIGRNDPCPCGSGKKYKKCHGTGG